MNVLFISKLHDRPFSGTDIVIPKIIKNVSKIWNCAYLDCGQTHLSSFSKFDNFYRLSEYKRLSKLPKPFNKPDLVIFQDFYIKEFIRLSYEIKKNCIPYIIVPHCSLTINAQKRKFVKKFFGNLLFFNKFVSNAKFVHFLTLNEKVSTSKNFKIKDYVIIGNGIDLPKNYYKVKNKLDFKIIYIGRIDIFHKGLDCLIDSISLDAKYFREHKIIIEIYGSEFENNILKLQKMIIKNNICDIVSYKGPIYKEEKEKCILESDAFIQTSRFEGLPTGVIEAISYGIPIIVTPGTNLVNEVKKYNLGFYSEFSSKDILNCIKKCYSNWKNFEIISNNEVEYAKNNYSWNSITKQIINKYTKKIKEKSC